MSDFEQRLQRLEEIAEQLRDGTIQVDDAAQLFEEGVKLARALDTELQRIERKVEVLANQPVDEDTPPSFELFPDLTGEDVPPLRQD